MIKGLCDFMKGRATLYVTTPPGLVDVYVVVVEIKCF